MKYALASQRKNAWSVDNKLSTIEITDKLMMAEALLECLLRFPKIDTLKALISGRDVISILPTGFGKSLIFQLFWEVKLASNPNTCILVVAPLNSIVEDQISVKLVGRPTRLRRFVAFVHLPFSFRSLDLLCRFTLCLWSALRVVL